MQFQSWNISNMKLNQFQYLVFHFNLNTSNIIVYQGLSTSSMFLEYPTSWRHRTLCCQSNPAELIYWDPWETLDWISILVTRWRLQGSPSMCRLVDRPSSDHGPETTTEVPALFDQHWSTINCHLVKKQTVKAW